MEEASEASLLIGRYLRMLIDGRPTAVAKTANGDEESDAEVVEVSWAGDHVFGLLGFGPLGLHG